MHEFGIASNIFETVRTEAGRLENGGRVTKVGLRIGDLSGVDIDALTFSFDALKSDTEFESLGLEIERVPHHRRCGACGVEFEVDVMRFDASCPSCGDTSSEFVSGDELEITYLEVEEP